MFYKKALSLTLGTAMTLSLAAPAMAAEEQKPWYAEAQTYVTDKGIMVGTDKGFEPQLTVTRGQAIQTMYNMEGKPPVEKNDYFSDTEGKWYADAANWAAERYLTDVPETGLFSGDEVITREEMAVILSRAGRMRHLAMRGGDVAIRSTADYDTLEDGEGKYSFEECFNVGLITGKGREDGVYLDPQGQTSRAEFAALMMRFDQMEPVYVDQYVEIPVEEQNGIPAHTIPAVLSLPASATAESPVPAVVMLHGTGSNKDEAGGGYVYAADRMAMYGIASLRIDFMGSGDSAASYTDYCYTSANQDAKAAADYLTALDGVNAEQLAVMGWSQGGTNALLAAAAYPETFHAVITWSGALELKDMFPDFEAAYATAKKDGAYEMTFDWREPLMVGERWFKEVKETDVEKEVGRIKAPILALNGDKDDVVVPETADRIVKAATASAEARTLLVPGADHTYNVFDPEAPFALGPVTDMGIGFLNQTFLGYAGKAYAENISKYGNVVTGVYESALMGAGYKPGDILKVTVGDTEVMLPYVTGYSNVDTGKALTKLNKYSPKMEVAVNMGDFAGTYGVTADTVFTFAMGEKEGYLEEYEIRNIDSLRTNNREDYSSDEVFANFRPVVMGDIKEGTLYRSSSPVNPELGRNTYSDALIKKAGVKTVINLADSKEKMEGYEGYSDSYYSTINVIPLDMGVDFKAPEFAGKLKTGLEFMIANEGPYLVHCTEGKDRAGFVNTLLEALMGATVEEMKADYMLSFENYYGVERGSERWEHIAESNVLANLQMIAGVDSVEALEGKTQSGAETYLTETVGLTADQVTALRVALGAKA